MKCMVIILLVLQSFSALAVRDERQLLKCLGAEEKKFHLSKDLGPLYDLNQRLISEMLQIPHAELAVENYNQICSPSSFSPAWKLLELSISKGKEIFSVPRSVQGSQRLIAMSMLDDYLESTEEIFLNFMTQLQAAAPTASCLKDEIPELDKFFNDIKYLEEDVDLKQVFAGRDLKIFEKLKDYKGAYKRCGARVKKKLKSESKAAPKKS